MLLRDVPDSPWQDLAANFFTYNHRDYLLIADTFSKYPFVYQISSKSADSIIRKLQNLISQYGPPKRFYSDNGAPFLSEAIQKFLALHNIDHITSSPHYPKSNSFIERQIKTIKTALDTARSSGKSLNDLLLSLRSTPIGPHLPCPREILHNRTQDWLGQPSQPTSFKEVRDHLTTQKSVQKKHYNERRNTKDIPELHPGQPVLSLSPMGANSYIEGTITGAAATPCSYMLEVQGRKYCHNKHHMCPMGTDTTSFSR